MIITPQACRRITAAVSALPVARRQVWTSWVGASDAPRTEIPYDVAIVARDALVMAKHEIEKELGRAPIDEDREADLLNDLGYVQSIETELLAQGLDN